MSFGRCNCKNQFFEKQSASDGSQEYERIVPSCNMFCPIKKICLCNNALNEENKNLTCCLKENVCKKSKYRFINCEKSNSERVLSESTDKLKNISIKKTKNKTQNKHMNKNHMSGLVVSLRYGKYSRKSKSRYSRSQVAGSEKSKIKKTTVKKKGTLEKRPGTPKKGKRGHLGGKAKGKPPEEEIFKKCDSDEESENLYFYRISLGYFQQYKDDSGASTSYQPEDLASPCSLIKQEDEENIFEEMELLELQKWGMSSLIPTKIITDRIQNFDKFMDSEF